MSLFKKKLGSVDLSNVSEGFAWYTIVTYFNSEEVVVRAIREKFINSPLGKNINEIYLPMKYVKEKIHLQDGMTKEKTKKVKGAFANYIFIRCILTEGLWNALRSVQGISIILTTGGIPEPIDDEAVAKIRRQQAPEGFSLSELLALRQKIRQASIITPLNFPIDDAQMSFEEKVALAIEQDFLIGTPKKKVCQQFLDYLSEHNFWAGEDFDSPCENVWEMFKEHTAFYLDIDGNLTFVQSKQKEDVIFLSEEDFVCQEKAD